ncbi:formyltransferase family protein [Segnochrobactrum spirostomi]|uniref:Formyl transferase N-terminal domain-containing protein n=1 Tax=Segnochrobactrum spirostomi TaxID=2608987 RepID=A0A6A7Y3X3_9HYPH|nr:hypothetical protein [Segnochrobactrum spirostomi]
MKISICGAIDSTWKDMLCDEGHTVHSIWMQRSPYLSSEVLSLAEHHGAALYFRRVNRTDMLEMLNDGVRLLISIGYPFLIPSDTPLWGVNIHPSLLPDGRGPYPIPLIIQSHGECAGFTIHKLSPLFDQGDVIYRERFAISEHDTCDTLLFRMYMHSSNAMRNIIPNIECYWAAATAQVGRPAWEARRFDQPFFNPNLLLEDCIGMCRRYGEDSTILKVSDLTATVSSIQGWKEAHSRKPGTVISKDEYRIVIAVMDGFVIIRYKLI